MKKKNEMQLAWSKYVNDKNNWSYKDPTYGNKIQGKLNARKYLCYNILRDLPLDRGFTKNSEFDLLIAGLSNLVDRYTKGHDNNRRFAHYYLTATLECFDDLIDVDYFTEKASEAIRLYRNS